ncbi:hypothetical protein SAMN02745146_1309 [Hymenobacter daecheongensis DSM 21074]|uniref:Uncharacterized protein n=1 Tax=Hymenobacter daecheongensis DSM 21074 TaxID=1121955 RepID=A0A1M6CXN4_9BACT|nr:hypothetical protein [Hymenobacter daecheongensis]SHI65792.1 hypothetical protein SAMN02745146_1309 [Hymenobacter daecheongensis DSM 21074]
MSAFITSFFPRLRFTLLTATLLFVLSLNHQAVATFRLPVGKATHVGNGPKGAVVKQKVTFEATTALAGWLAPALQAWLPAPALPTWLGQKLQPSVLRPRPSAVPDLFRARLLLAALSPQAP